MAEKKLKRRLVELIIDEESERFGVEAISLVEFPAIEENWVFFNKDINRYFSRGGSYS